MKSQSPSEWLAELVEATPRSDRRTTVEFPSGHRFVLAFPRDFEGRIGMKSRAAEFSRGPLPPDLGDLAPSSPETLAAVAMLAEAIVEPSLTLGDVLYLQKHAGHVFERLVEVLFANLELQARIDEAREIDDAKND